MWCSGITSASHAEGPGFEPRRLHLFQMGPFEVISKALHISDLQHFKTFEHYAESGVCFE